MKRVVVLCSLLLSACGGSPPPPEPEPEPTTGAEEPPPPPPPPPARVRVIHAAFDPSVASIGARIDGGDPVAVDLAYLHASAYFEVPGAVEHTLGVFGPDDVELMGWTMPILTDGTSYTVVATSADEMPVLFAASDDVATEPNANTAGLRFFHGLVGVDSIDVCLAGASARADGVAIFTAVSPSSFAGTPEARYSEISATGVEVTLQLRTSNATPCHGRVQGVARFVPITGARYTLVAVGRQGGRPRIDRELLLCVDPPATDTSCTAVPISAR